MPPTDPHPDDDAISPIEALGRLDDEGFLGLLRGVRERRGWRIDRRDATDWYVDLFAHTTWPARRRHLLRVHLPESDRRVSATEVRHFTRAVQNAEVDGAALVTTDDVPESVRRRGAEFEVDIVDAPRLVRRFERLGGADLLAERVGPPVAVDEGVLARAPDRLIALLAHHDVADRVDDVLAARLPEDPSQRDFAALSIRATAGALVVATLLFAGAVALGSGVGFWLVLGLFFVVAYGALLPAMAADIYLVRRLPDVEWIPSWYYLGAFLLAPLMLVAGTHYWFHRRRAVDAGAEPDGEREASGDR